MKTKNQPEQEKIEIQERLVRVIEDDSLPAGQVLNEPSDQEQRPALFIP